MHRSSTSLVARTLNNEVHMGEHLLVGLSDNPKGHYENVDILKINHKILYQSGGSWHNPPPREKIIEVGQKFEEDIKAIIYKEIELAKSKNMESWGFKDPRTSLTIDVWYKYIPNPQFVVCYRNAKDIAISLQKRNGFSLEKGMELTNEYYRRISEFLEKFYAEH
jgi:hypothetical protein